MVGDLNGDNVPDIFSTGKVGQPSYHFLQEGGTWRVEEVPLTFRHTGQSPFDSRQGIDMSELADVDGDGLQDLILGTWTQNHQDGVDPTLLSKFPAEIYFGDSSGISATPSHYQMHQVGMLLIRPHSLLKLEILVAMAFQISF